MDNQELARYLDLTLLKPEAMPTQIDALCEQALTHDVYGVCVNPVYVRRVADRLKMLSVRPIAVIGFPLGANAKATKVDEAKAAFDDGAWEIDMVMQVGLFKAGMHTQVHEEIAAVVHNCGGIPVKVIIESALLTTAEIEMACRIVHVAGAHFVKTSTGFCPAGGATIEAVRTMAHTVNGFLGVKASGGIKTREQALAMIAAGATRIGVSDISNILV